jgi:hypothetical protein
MFLAFMAFGMALGVGIGVRMAKANAEVERMIREAREYHPSRWNR